MFSPALYVEALRLAAERHLGQKVPGTELPYLVHVASVTAELIAALPESGIEADLAVVCALLHDTIEDSAKTDADKAALAGDIEQQFGSAVRAGVEALSKRKVVDGKSVDKDAQMADSLLRIRQQPRAVWAVKLADRITNLAPPPKDWAREKRVAYRAQAQTILDALGEASPKLAARLRSRIDGYAQHCG